MFFFEQDYNLTLEPPISIESAYLLLLNDNISSALEIFKSIDSPRAKWGVSLCEILSGFLEHYPSYFGIRNFLEIDGEFLLKNNKMDYLERLSGSCDFLININKETYKYMARLMLENDLNKLAFNYLEKSKNIFYKDPELHFLYFKYYLNNKNYNKALISINECLKILPDYFPAKQQKQYISNIIAQTQNI